MIKLMTKVDISHKTIFFIAGFLGLLWIIYLIKEVIILFFIAVILMSALAPLVDRLVLWKIPKGLAIALTYLLLLGSVVTMVTLILTPLADQILTLVTSLPKTVETLLPPGLVDPRTLQQELTNFSRNAVGLTLTIFSDFITLVSVAVLTFYLLLDRERMENLVAEAFVNRKDRARRLISQMEYKLGAWVRGQAVLSLLIGLLSYVLLFALNLPYALPMAILAGILEVVPVIGPIVSAIPPILIGYTVSPSTALLVAIGYLAIQQAESHFIVPQVMKKAVGLNPLVVILAIAAGGKLLGLSGALLAVPITVVIQLIAEDILNKELG